VGNGFAGRVARQHSNLTAPERGALGGVVLTLLAIDGVISAVVGALFLPLRIGAVPLPISAVATAAVNVVLVWAAMHHTDSGRLAALPLWTWLATVAVLTLGGPGNDIVFGGQGVMAYAVLWFLALGAAPSACLLRRRGARTG
jgi:hypothetical protein